MPGIVDTLRLISESGRTFVSIVSGRPVAELTHLLGDLNVTLVGSHGFELKMPHEQVMIMEPAPEQLAGLECGGRLVVENGLSGLVEAKIGSIAVHTRGLEREESERTEKLVVSLWSDIARKCRLRCLRFNGGVELRADGWNKGDAVMTLLCAYKPDFGVYIGDDETDEDVFRNLPECGVGLKVGCPGSATMAAGILRDCVAVREFLQIWRLLDT